MSLISELNQRSISVDGSWFWIAANEFIAVVTNTVYLNGKILYLEKYIFKFIKQATPKNLYHSELFNTKSDLELTKPGMVNTDTKI